MKLIKLPMVLEDTCPDKDLETPTVDIWVNPEHVISVEEDCDFTVLFLTARADARNQVTVALPAAEVVRLLTEEGGLEVTARLDAHPGVGRDRVLLTKRSCRG